MNWICICSVPQSLDPTLHPGGCIIGTRHDPVKDLNRIDLPRYLLTQCHRGMASRKWGWHQTSFGMIFFFKSTTDTTEKKSVENTQTLPAIELWIDQTLGLQYIVICICSIKNAAMHLDSLIRTILKFTMPFIARLDILMCIIWVATVLNWGTLCGWCWRCKSTFGSGFEGLNIFKLAEKHSYKT